jgi:mannose-1-phosphate guanylyltransferase
MSSVPEAIILCGGAGSRLRMVTDGPKAMVTVGGRPFLELLLRQLRRHGIERVILAVGYQSDVIRSYFGGEACGMQLVYSPETTPLGTGGALRKAADLARSSVALVMNGDSYTDASLSRLLLHHRDLSADMSVLVVRPDGREDCGTVSVDGEGRLLAFREKQSVAGPKYINAGIYVLSRTMLLQIPSGVEISLEREVVPNWLERGKRVMAMLDDAACIDIGTPERYRNAQTALAAAEECGDPAAHRVGR